MEPIVFCGAELKQLHYQRNLRVTVEQQRGHFLALDERLLHLEQRVRLTERERRRLDQWSLFVALDELGRHVGLQHEAEHEHNQ